MSATDGYYDSSTDYFDDDVLLGHAIETSLQEEKRQAAQQHEDDEYYINTMMMQQQQAIEEAVVENKLLLESQQTSSDERNQGAWDCSVCTFRNTPYRPKCEACCKAAPPHVLVFEQEMPSTRFGVELELFIPQGKRDGFTLEHMARQLSAMGPPEIRFRGYTHETTAYWKIVTDSSVQNENENDDLGLEIVSPVLQSENGLAEVRQVMEHVRRLGIGTNRTCSFHVHVDCECLSLSVLKRMAQCFVSLENAFDLLVSRQPTTSSSSSTRAANRNRYCRSNRLVFGERSNRQRWERIEKVRSKQELVELISPDRYYKLNMTNLIKSSRPSTCEFRHHGGVQDICEAEAWIRLIVVCCRKAAEKDISACLLPEDSTPKQELRALFDLVNCHGLEQFFTVERRLFAVDDTTTHCWRCRVCRRKFDTSRSLAQHTAARGHY